MRNIFLYSEQQHVTQPQEEQQHTKNCFQCKMATQTRRNVTIYVHHLSCKISCEW